MTGVNLNLREHPLRIWPDAALASPTQQVVSFDQDLKTLIAFMTEAMYALGGVGLAANQVGFGLRVAVIDTMAVPATSLTAPYRRPFFVMVNPQINHYEFPERLDEGCLSVPNCYAAIERYKMVDVTYETEDGSKLTQRYEGITAQAVQHEIDHLNGRIFSSRASLLNRDIINRKLKKLRRRHGG